MADVSAQDGLPRWPKAGEETGADGVMASRITLARAKEHEKVLKHHHLEVDYPGVEAEEIQHRGFRT